MQEDRQQRLKQLFESGTGIKHALDAADEVMGFSIVFIGLSYELIAYSKSRADGDPLWAELIQEKQFSHKTVDFFKRAKFIEAYFSAPVVLMQSPGLRDRINGVIYDADGIQVGSICSIACRPIEDTDYKLVEMLCDRLTLELRQDETLLKSLRQAAESSHDLIHLIEDGHTLTDAQTKTVKDMNKRLKKHIYVAVIDIIHYDHTNTHLTYFIDVFKRIQKDYCYFTYLNNIVAVFSTDRAVLNFEKEMQKLNDHFCKYNIFAGISSGFQNLFDVKIYFKQALNALNYGMSLDSGRHIFSYDTFRIELFLNAHADGTAMEALCHPIFFAVRDYDNQKETNYLDILYTYFMCGCNLRLIANALKIPKPDVKKHLQNISKLFDVDFGNGNLLFAIFRSLKLYKCFADSFTDKA